MPPCPAVSNPSSPTCCLAGATASGKTAVAQALAERLGLPILSADAMLVYAGMDIGTAKPTAAERGAVPYFGLDLVTPGEDFSAAAWLAEARRAQAALGVHVEEDREPVGNEAQHKGGGNIRQREVGMFAVEVRRALHRPVEERRIGREKRTALLPFGIGIIFVVGIRLRRGHAVQKQRRQAGAKRKEAAKKPVRHIP